MTTEYAVEVYNKYHDNFVEKIDVFGTYEEAERYIKETDIPLNKDEYVEITEIEYYDDEEDEIMKYEIWYHGKMIHDIFANRPMTKAECVELTKMDPAYAEYNEDEMEIVCITE